MSLGGSVVCIRWCTTVRYNAVLSVLPKLHYTETLLAMSLSQSFRDASVMGTDFANESLTHTSVVKPPF
jgi:hypothetical protein